MRYTFCLLLFTSTLAYGQVKDDMKFEAYAGKQDSLCHVAYKKRDTIKYKAILKELLAKYDKLPAEEKTNEQHYIRTAYYNLCCTYSLMGKKSMALLYLKKSMEAGYYEYDHMQEDSDLNNIRHEAKFDELMKPLKNNYDYMYVLKNADKYNNSDARELPAFTYEAASDASLTALRKGYNLDSVAGRGNDISQVINLLHWIHNLVPHDGQHQNPEVKNAMSMIALCKKDKRGLNCRGLATVLNECYLSLGFKSRFVTCLPKDSLKIDEDCHVINMVFIPSLKKWVWMDPTNDAYVMNENGDLLSIQEVRERLIDGKPLILNPDANWNHKESVVRSYYLYHYMAKNLYMIECPLNSQYNTETREAGKTISEVELLPLEYYNQGQPKNQSMDENNKATWINYKTNNADKFWALPN